MFIVSNMNKDKLLEKEEFNKVVGEIYKIINLTNNSLYIGQTRSHRLNRGKYRPFGYIGRFKDHISEATHISKRNSCKYLNNALLKYGIENFKCELLITCPIDELDHLEVKFINEFNTKAPNGYNLTNGGQKKGFTKGPKINLENSELFVQIKPLPVENSNLKKSESTKKLISERLIEFNKDENVKKEHMKRSQTQHFENKFHRYPNVRIDENNIDAYIHVIRNNILKYDYITVKIEKIKTSFVGKYETIEELRARARLFILTLIKQQHDQIAGTPLEPSLPLANGNISKELG